MNQSTFTRFLLLAMVWCGTALSAFGQGRIAGKIVDEKKEPVMGATVIVVGTTLGAATDLDGNYLIEGVAEGETKLQTSYIGYETKDITVKVVKNQTVTADIQMGENRALLEQVVVVGYGTAKKRELLTSIAKIDAKDLTDNTGGSFETNLQGKASGVQIIQGSGMAGAGATIRIRGISSISGGGDPLYVVDGIPITQDVFAIGASNGQNINPLSSINPSDIASIEILKDAAATGIYGSRGSNGVVLITTKRGKEGKATFEFSHKTGWATPATKQKMLNATQWLQINQEAFENDGGTGRAPLYNGLTYAQIAGQDNDWFDLMTRVGIKNEENLSMRVGGKKLSAFASVGYTDADSYIRNNKFQRYSGRVNVDYTPIKWAKISLNTSLAQAVTYRVPSSWAGGLGRAMSTALPIYPTEISKANPYFNDNPFRDDLQQQHNSEIRTINNLVVTLTPIKKLTLTGQANYDFSHNTLSTFKSRAFNMREAVPRTEAAYKEVETNNWSTFGTAEYQILDNETNSLKVMAGGEYQSTLIRKRGIYNDTMMTNLPYLNSGETIWENKDEQKKYDTPSLDEKYYGRGFGRINYSFRNKILAQASVSVDASSVFGENNRYAIFPTASLGYILTEEPFLKNNKTISLLKVKANYGRSGSSDIEDFYKRFGLYKKNNTTYDGTTLLYSDQLANPNLSWETKTTIDGGIEIGFFKDRVMIEASYYNQISTFVLLNSAVQASTGFSRYFQNKGTIQNQGYELGVQLRNINKKNFKWNTDFNVSHNENMVLDMGIGNPDAIGGTGDTRVLVGQPMGVNFLVRFSHVDPATGKPVYLDKNGAETFTFSEDNRVVAGNVQPNFIGGMTNTFVLGNFNLKFLFTFTQGGNIYDDAAKRQLGVVSDWNMRADIIDHWTTPGQVGATYPKLTQNAANYSGPNGTLGSYWNYNTTQWLVDASYLRFKNLTLGYEFKELAKRAKASRIGLNFTVINLWTLKDRRILDPEIMRDQDGRQGRNVSPNVSYLTSPQERSYTLGLNITF
jgi:TonB-dependent starch-binding outer membrane protein SusC